MEPEQVGRYKIVQLLGRGGLGSVYEAEDPAIGRKLAIKVIHLVGDVDYQLKRITREIAVLGKLDHPNIVRIYDVGQQSENIYIVMEYVDGEDVEHLIAAGRITGSLVRIVLSDVAKALDYAHGQGVVHRDIKPSNILVSRVDLVKITDFGIARIERSEKTTAQAIMVGTFPYMSPEQIESREITAAVDQFSLGVVAYRLLTGAMPFEGDSVASTLHRILTETPAAPHILNDTLTADASAALLKALDKKPQNRYPTCEKFVQTLLDATDNLSGWALAGRRAVNTRSSDVAKDVGRHTSDFTAISRLEHAEAPTDFFIPKTTFFKADQVRFEKIEESIKFYRENLNIEFQRLTRQADLAYKLWLSCVAIAFLLLAVGIILMFTTDVTKGVVTAASTVLVYFIQRVFQQREDYYRKAADEKSEHLQYGNQWLLVIQSIDAIENPGERVKRQARLVDVLTHKLSYVSDAKNGPHSLKSKKKKKSAET